MLDTQTIPEPSIAELAERSLRMVREAKTLVFDTETSGVDWKRNFPVGYVFCDRPSSSIYIPTRHGGGGNLEDIRVPTEADAWDRQPTSYELALARAFRDRSANSEMRTVGHHLKFDCHMAANVGIMLGRNLSCTQNNEAMIDEYTHGFGLDDCCTRWGVDAKKGAQLYLHLANLFGGEATKAQMANFWKLPGTDPMATEYARGDGVSTGKLFVSQRKRILSEDMELVWKLENELIWTLFRMERRGIRIDQNYLDQIDGIIADKLRDTLAALPEGFNPRSPNHLRALCGRAGRIDWPTTPKGNPSFKESFLESFPEGARVVKMRQLTNIINSFVEPLRSRHMFEGRVHATLNQLKNDSGGTPSRLSCQHPNLQQVPKRNKELAPLFRRLFIPDDGMDFWEGDYSQCEPRLFAHFSNAPALVAGYNKEPYEDAHTVVAELLGVERDPTAKRMNMGLFTCMYPKTFSMHMNWPIDRATEAYNLWFDRLPEIRVFQEANTKALRSEGFVTTLLGRRGHLESPRFSYRGTSKVIQGSNADILKWKMREVDAYLESIGDPAHLLMTVHDAFEWQAPKGEEGEKLSKTLIEIMEDVNGEPFNLKVPFLVEADKGPNWSVATFGEKG